MCIRDSFYPRKDRRLVQTPAGDRGSQARRCGNGFRAQPAAAENPHGPRHSGHSGLFEVFLHRFDDELLYVFPDGQVRRIGARCAILSFRFSCGFGCGYVHRRTAGRPHRTQICDLGFDSGGCAFYPAATLRRFGCDRRAVRSDRAGHFVGLFRHSGLCHRSDARQGGDDRRSLFRPDVRAGRSRFGVFRLAGGPDEYRVYFSGQHAVAPVGCYHRFFAEYRVEKRKIGFSVHVLLLLFGAGRG